MDIVQDLDFPFQVQRNEPEFIVPANPTPHEFKQLSDFDDQESLRFHVPIMNIYQHNPSLDGRDPVKVIKDAIAKALVFYYPLAGRLREGPGRKLFVECTGEGILFIEANADVTLEQYGDALQSSILRIEDVIYNVPNSDGILNTPLFLIQVTRLKCGSFIFGLRFNHTMVDGFGTLQFAKAIGEIARGACAPSILPVWQRALLMARDPPRITFRHYEYDQVASPEGTTLIPMTNLVHRLFFFGPVQISALRGTLPTHLRDCSNYELITAFVWRLRTVSLQYKLEEKVRLIFPVNLRSKMDIPFGYYGNAFVTTAAITTVVKLCGNPLDYAVDLVRKAKVKMTKEYVKSALDLMVIKGRPAFTEVGSYLVSDLTKIGSEEIDFGWGKAVYGGLTIGESGTTPGMFSFCVPFMNKKGEKGIVLPLRLPAPAMEKFMEDFHASFQVK